jgi:methylphosphotriester-DNA--protein-cysteine methyltransferase
MTIEKPVPTTTEGSTRPQAHPLDDDACYRAMQARDTAFDGVFVICVRTTGIYCRPSCTVRQPLRKNIFFLPGNEAAEAAGFRACKRCKPRDNAWTDSAPEVVASATAALDEANLEPLTVQHLADIAGVTTGALNAAFRRVLGVTALEYATARPSSASRRRHSG